MSFLAFTGLLNFIHSFFAGIFIVFKNPRNSLNRLAFLVNACIALYSFAYFFWQLQSSISLAAAWFKVLIVGIILIQVAFLHFVFSFTEILNKRKTELFFYYAVNMAFIILNFTTGFFYNLEPRFNIGYWPDPNPFFHVYLIFWLWQCVYGLFWLLKGLNKFSGLKREQLKYIILSAIVGFIGGASNWPVWYSINFPPYTNILITLYVIILFYAIIRHRLLNIRIMLTHASIFIILYTCILAVPLVIAHITGYGLISFLVLFIMAAAGNIIYRFLQQKADLLINSRQNEYYQLLFEASQNIVRERNLERLLRTIVIGVKRILKVDFVKIYLHDQNSSSFKLRAKIPRNIASAPEEFLNDEPVIDIIKEAGSVLSG